MKKFIRVTAAIAFTIAVVVAWANASIRMEAGQQMSGTVPTEAPIDLNGLTKNAGNLPVQEFPAY